VLGVLMRDDRSHEGTTNAEQAGSHKSADPLAPPTFVITAEQYNRMARVMEKKTPVRVRVSLKAQASDADVNSANIVGEIPGGQKKDEVVMIGGHFDSLDIGLGVTRQAQELHQQSLLTSVAPLREQRFGMIGILDIQTPIVTADMTGDEFVLMVNAHPLGIRLHGHALTRILRWH